MATPEQMLELLVKQNAEWEKMAKFEEELGEKLENRKKIQQELLEDEAKIQKLTKEEISAIEKIALEQQKIQSVGEQRLKVQEEQKKILEKQLELLKSGDKKEKERAKLWLEQKKFSQETLKLFDEKIKKQKEFNLQIAAEKEDTERIHSTIQSFARWLGFASSANETWLGKLGSTFKSTTSISNSLRSFGASIRTSFSPLLIFDNTLKKVAESMFIHGVRLDDTISSFNKATGAGGKFNETIDNVRFGSQEAGIGISQSGEAIESLFIQMKDFTDLNQRVQEELVRTTAQLDVLGVSSQTTAKSLDILTNTLQMNAEEAIQTQTEIVKTAKTLGLAPQKLADDFLSSLPKLAQYGKQSISIFKELAVQSKETGVEINALLGISQQFDTFEGAATAAGKLNAILGGGLINSVELLTATESKRIDLLRQSITLSGRNFQEMTKFEKMAVASAAGISDVNEAMRIFGASDEEFYRLQKAQEAEAMSTKELTESAKQAVSVKQKLAMISEGLTGALLPLVDVVRVATEFFLKINDIFGKKLGPGLVVITGLFWLLSKALGFINLLNSAAIALGIKKTTVIVAETSAQNAHNVSSTFSLRTLLAKIASMTAAVAVIVAKTTATIALTAASWAISLATEAWTAAQWLLNAALTANPVGLIVLAVGALIAEIAILIIYYEEINGWINKTTGGFFELWDVMLFGLGPLGWIAIAVKKVVENFEKIASIFQKVIGFVEHLWDLLTKNPMSNLAKFLNISSPAIPAFAEGVSNAKGGLALVGEEGPELVNLPRGSDVISSEQTNRLTSAGIQSAQSKMAVQKEMINTIERTKNVSSTTQGVPSSPTMVNLYLDKYLFGKAILEVFEENMKLHLVDSV